MKAPPYADHLHLGCGLTAPDGWLNVDGSWQVVLARYPRIKKTLVSLGLLPRRQADIPWASTIVRLNLTRPLPFADGSFTAVYSSHTLEHLYYDDAVALLKECHRVLRPGGICRAVVPDLESMVTRYVQARSAHAPGAASRLMEELLVHPRHRGRTPLDFYHRLTAFHSHKWMYDAASMQELFTAVGFLQVRQAGCLESRIARIAEVENPGRILDGQGVAIEGLK